MKNWIRKWRVSSPRLVVAALGVVVGLSPAAAAVPVRSAPVAGDVALEVKVPAHVAVVGCSTGSGCDSARPSACSEGAGGRTAHTCAQSIASPDEPKLAD